MDRFGAPPAAFPAFPEEPPLAARKTKNTIVRAEAEILPQRPARKEASRLSEECQSQEAGGITKFMESTGVRKTDPEFKATA